jgi:hypothetical protein
MRNLTNKIPAEPKAPPEFFISKYIFKKTMNKKLTQWHFFYDGSVDRFYYIYRQL